MRKCKVNLGKHWVKLSPKPAALEKAGKRELAQAQH
jgi:hypothetical protein